jgi:superfamily I DNA/RNA helicase
MSTQKRQTRVTKIDGAPGSGKTYQLLQNVKRLKQTEDMQAWQMKFLTFSRAARRDVETRLMEVFPDEDRDTIEGAVSTVHGAALGQAIGEVYGREEFDEQWELIDENRDADKFARFFREEYPFIEYEVTAKDPLQALERGEEPRGSTGNDIMAAYSFLRSKMWGYDDNLHAPIDIKQPPHRVAEVMRTWDDWKREHGYLQHDDYVHDLIEAGTGGGDFEYTNWMFIDEFQDLSPLQYKLYKMWRDSGDLQRIYIAGDADQSIYGFRGADPRYFRGTDTDKVEPQKQSRRCPSEIAETANKTLSDGGMTPAEEGGVVRHTSVSGDGGFADLVKEEVQRSDGDVMVLARTNHYVGELTETLRDHGIPYYGLSKTHRRWRSPAIDIYKAVRWLRGGERPDLVSVMGSIDSIEEVMQETLQRRIEAGQIDREAFLEWFDVEGSRGFLSALDLKDWQYEMIHAAVRSDTEHGPRDVRIGTLHAAKGLEADSVILLPDYSERMYERYQDGAQAEEQRVFYVGASRSSRRLTIAHSVFDGPEFPPLGQ